MVRAQIQAFAQKFKKELKVYKLVLQHADTPLPAKIFLGLAVAYLLMPIDLIPDCIPVLGQLDDLIIVPLLAWAGMKLIPSEILKQCREKAEQASHQA